MFVFVIEFLIKICNFIIVGICIKNFFSRNLAGDNSRSGNLVEKVDEEEVDEEMKKRMEKIVKEVESGLEESDLDNEFGRYSVEEIG